LPHLAYSFLYPGTDHAITDAPGSGDSWGSLAAMPDEPDTTAGLVLAEPDTTSLTAAGIDPPAADLAPDASLTTSSPLFDQPQTTFAAASDSGTSLLGATDVLIGGQGNDAIVQPADTIDLAPDGQPTFTLDASPAIPQPAPQAAPAIGQGAAPTRQLSLTVAVVMPAASAGGPSAPPTPEALGLPAGFVNVPAESVPPRIANAISNSADVVVKGNLAAQQYGVTGAGITIGIISDSFDNLGDEVADINAGDLPSAASGQLNVLQDQIPTDPLEAGTDEGRAMAEIVPSIRRPAPRP